MQDYGSPEKLMAALKRLAHDKAAYEKHMAWKYKPWAQLSAGFRAYVEHTELRRVHPRCQVRPVHACKGHLGKGRATVGERMPAHSPAHKNIKFNKLPSSRGTPRQTALPPCSPSLHHTQASVL